MAAGWPDPDPERRIFILPAGELEAGRWRVGNEKGGMGFVTLPGRQPASVGVAGPVRSRTGNHRVAYVELRLK
jgi:hypothetical protein